MVARGRGEGSVRAIDDFNGPIEGLLPLLREILEKFKAEPNMINEILVYGGFRSAYSAFQAAIIADPVDAKAQADNFIAVYKEAQAALNDAIENGKFNADQKIRLKQAVADNESYVKCFEILKDDSTEIEDRVARAYNLRHSAANAVSGMSKAA